LISIKSQKLYVIKLLASFSQGEPPVTNNVGTFDRIARIVVGVALIAFALAYIAPGTSWSWVGWIGVLPILTAIFSTCPAYTLFGMSTR
jgi:sulfite exporter TauE/SafE